jgi:DNA-binding CsgD family transcriptional regulator
MRVADWLRTPSVRRSLLVAAVLSGCFVWAMIVFGLSFAMVERGLRQWWVMPPFGVLVLLIAVFAVRDVLRSAPPATAETPSAETPSAETPSAGRPRPAPVTRVLVEPLSPRELEVLAQLAAGRSNKEIATVLFVAPGTVKAHLNHIFRKLGAGSRLQAVAHAREAGLLDSTGE